LATNVGTLEGLIRWKYDGSSLQKAIGDVVKAHAKIEEFGDQLSKVGSAISTFTLPLSAAAAASLKFATDFNKSMANVASLIPGNIAHVEDLKRSVQDMSVAVAKSTEDLAGGLYQAISAFGDTADTVKILEINARAATAGVAETAEAINLTSAVTKGYGDTTAAAVQKASDLALLTVRLGQTTFPELASSMGKVIPVAQSLNQSQEELFNVFATLTGVTGNTAEVSTQYKAILIGLINPTDTLKELTKKLGYESGQAMLEQLGLVKTLQTITASAEASHRPITDFISSSEAIPAVLALAGAQAKNYTEKLAQMSQWAGTTNQAFKEQAEGVNAAGFAFDQLKRELVVILQQFGDALIPTLVDFGNFIKPIIAEVADLARRFAELPKPIRDTIIVVAGIVAAVGPALFVVGKLVSAFGEIVAIYPKVVLAFKAMTGGVYGMVTAVGALLLILDAGISKWKQLMDQQIQYQVSTGNLEGAALSFVRKSNWYAVSTSEFENAKKTADELAERIRRDQKLIDEFKKSTSTADERAPFKPEGVRVAEKEIDSLRQTWSKLAIAINKAKIASDEATAPATAGGDGSILGINIPEIDKAGKATASAASHIQEIIDRQKLATESAHALAQAEKSGGAVVADLNNKYQMQEEILSAVQSIDNASVSDKSRLTKALIELISKEQEYNDLQKINATLRDADRSLQHEQFEGQIRIQEAMSGSTDAIRQLIAAEEAENKAFSLGLDTNHDFVDSLTKSIKAHLDYGAALNSNLATIERNRKLEQELSQLNAQIEDTISGSTEATRQNQIVQEAQNRALAQGALFNRDLYEQILKNVEAEYSLTSAKEAELAVEERRADLRSQLLQASVDIETYQSQIDVIKRYGEEIGSIINRYGLEAKAAREAAIQEQILAAARKENINFKVGANGSLVGTSDEDEVKLLQLEGEIRAGADALDEFKSKLASIDISESLKQPFVDLKKTLQDDVFSSINDFIENGKVDWQSYWKSFEHAALQAVEAWLVRAIKAELLIRAEKRQTALEAKAQGVGGGTTGSSSTSSAASGAASSWGAFGAVIGVIALILAADKWFQKKKKDAAWESVRVDDRGPNPYGAYGQTGMRERDEVVLRAHKVAEEIRQAIYGVLDSITASGLVNLPQIQIRMRNNGKAFESFVNGIFVGYFTDMKDASDAAIIAAFKASDLSKLPALVQRAIRESTAQTIEEFQRGVVQAQDIAQLGMSQWAKRLEEILNVTRQRLRTLDELFGGIRGLLEGENPPSGMGGNVTPFRPTGSGGPVTFNKNAVFKPIDEESDARRRIMEEQARQIQALVADVLTSIGVASAGIRQHVNEVAESLTFIGDHLEQLGISTEEFARITREAGENIYADIAGGLLKYVHDNKTRMALEQLRYKQEIYNYRIEFELARQRGLLTEQEIEDIQRLFNALPSKVPSSGGGGRGAGGGRDSARTFLEDRTYQLAGRSLSDYLNKIRDVNREYEEQIKQAGRDISLRSQLISLREQELQLLRQEQVTSLISSFREFVGLVGPFDKIKEASQDLVRSINDSPLGDARKANMIRRVLESLDQQIQRMSNERASSLLGQMAGDLERFGANQSLIHDAQVNMAILEHTIKMANYEQEINLLRAEGRLAPEILATLDRSLEFLKGIDPTKFIDPIVTQPWKDWWETNTDAADRFAEALDRAKDLLSKYQEDGLTPLQRDIRSINKDFEDIIKAMGETPEIMDTYASAIKRTIDEFLQPIRDTRRDLFYGDLSTVDVEAQQRQALIDFADAQRRFAAHDLSVVEDVPEIVQRLLELTRESTPIGSVGFSDIAEQVDEFLREIENMNVSSVLDDPIVQHLSELTDVNQSQLDALESIYNQNYSVVRSLQSIDGRLGRTGGTGLSNVQ
jgi:TP901 family phage tail tape measure protein